MLRRPHYIGMTVLIGLVLVLLTLPASTTNRLKLALGGLFLPLFSLAGSGSNMADGLANRAVSRKFLLQENARYRIENERLKIETLQLNQSLLENAQLRQALGWQKGAPWKLRLAEVTMRDPANWWRNCSINLGSRDGMRTNLTVLSADGLVGRIDSVGLTQSRVVLIGDPTCRVSAMIEETRDNGVILSGGSSVLDQSIVELDFLPPHSQLKPGQRVVTSGFSGIFPKGILVGYIIDSRSVEYGLYMEARVKLAANLRTMEQVWVMIPADGGTP